MVGESLIILFAWNIETYTATLEEVNNGERLIILFTSDVLGEALPKSKFVSTELQVREARKMASPPN